MTDNRELLNDAEVDFLLSGAAEATTKVGASLEDGNQTVTMRGDLHQISLADIFQTLSMAKMEGVLRVRNPLEERQVFCSDGYVQILVPGRLTLRRLGQRLIQAGVIQPEQLRSALLEQRKEKLPLGELLVRSGTVSQEQIDDIVGMQVAEDLFSLFTWQNGSFEFFKGDPVPEAVRATFADCPQYEISSLLLEVARRSDEWQTILETIRDLDEIPIRIADPANADDLEPEHRDVLAGADGRSTYRQIAEQTTQGLFDAARAARDLVRGGILAPIDDAGMIAVAHALAAEGEKRRAVVLVQTLSDRPGDRELEVVQSMAQVLELAGERRFAGIMLLQAAQQCPDAARAIELARSARKLVPHDPGALSFLRTTLIAHDRPDSPELEKVTLDLLDALIDGDVLPVALELIEDSKRTGTCNLQILTREARARQKSRDAEGAIQVLFELAAGYQELGNRQKTIEAYETILRLDRTRREAQKALTLLRRTRVGRLVRAAAGLLSLLLVGGMGVVWWRQHSFEESLQQATAELTGLLEQGDRATARAHLEQWRVALGDCEAIDDLASRVAFAEATESARLDKMRRVRVHEQLAAAAQALDAGEVQQAMQLYAESAREPGLEREVQDVVVRRLQALADRLQACAERLPGRMPPPPEQLFDRKLLAANQGELQQAVPLTLIRAHAELVTLLDAGTRDLLDGALLRRLQDVVRASAAPIAEARRLHEAYAAAMTRGAAELRLDPLFKAAVAKEAEHAFAEALQLYRQLEQQETGDAEMRAHFRDRVARNATIVRLLAELQTATDAGDFQAAQQHLRALRTAFPDVPFAQLVRLPLQITSVPTGATVWCDDRELGHTPLLLARCPADETRLRITAAGYADHEQTIRDDGVASVQAALVLQARYRWQHDSAIDVAPALTDDGSLICVDRSGTVLRVAQDGAVRWRVQTNDLSGLLTAPRIDQGQALVASLDGELRSIDLATGAVSWHLADLPCETAPVLVGHTLLLATTDRRLHAVALDERRRLGVELPELARGRLLAHGNRVIATGERGRLSAWNLTDLTPAWQRGMEPFAAPNAQLSGDLLVLADDQGHLAALRSDTGDVVWQQSLGTSTLGIPVVAGGAIWCVTTERLLRRAIADGAELPAVARGDSDWAGEPTAFGERVVVPLRNEQMQVLDAATGAPTCRLRGGARCRSIAFDGHLMIQDRAHVLRIYDHLP
ncbi:MAG: PQQ-binding-like beta-propeller repeat protein [Planctomycetes bacterium]|nr:PQQ-binding-like beta-propeller repeat protein [Planctomycetota bacterium]